MTVLVVRSEVQLIAAHQRRINGPRSCNPAVIVQAGVDRMRSEQAGVEPEIPGLVDHARRETDAPSVDERIIERRTFREREEPRAADLLETVPGLVISDQEIVGLVR